MFPPQPQPPPTAAAIRVAPQPSPFQTPDCTTRTLAFDSAASSAAPDEDALQRARKRKRRVEEAAAFVTTRRRTPRRGAREDGEDALQRVDEDEEDPMAALSARTPAIDLFGRKREDDRRVSSNQDEARARPKPPVKSRVASHGRGEDRQEQVAARLRRLAFGCRASHHATSALFYADKLLSVSREPEDVLMFADACFLTREFHRAIHAIKQARLVEVDDHRRGHLAAPTRLTLKAALLLGQCLQEIKQRDECLELLSKVLPEREQDAVALARRVDDCLEQGGDGNSDADGINIVASLALLQGETHEALGNRENATVSFRTALRCDVHCAEAFFHLFDKQMLSADEEKRLVASLDFSSDEMNLLQALYQTHVGKYDTMSSVEARFTPVEDEFGLHDNLDMNVTKAETYYYQHDIQRAHEICQRIRGRDPFNFRIITVFVATLVELGKKRELYHYAHQLVDVYPKKAAAWYTVGCYYLVIDKFEAAQRYFHKATTLEPTYAPAWIGFGNSFAAQDESDQAMSSYRTASSLFPGSHLPPLYIGMEYVRTNNLVQAHEYLRQAASICPTDPLVYNELGTVHYKRKEFARAIEMFNKALQLCRHLPERLMDAWEPTLFNLGYSYRKLRMFDQAIHYFQAALRLSPRNASVLAALGFTHHMKGDLEAAIESYHAVLAYNPEDSLAGTMITVAFEESLSSSHASLARLGLPPGGSQRNRHHSRKQLGHTPSARPAADTAVESDAAMDDHVLRRLDLDQSYSSIEQSRPSLACSSLDFSDDSMNMEE